MLIISNLEFPFFTRALHFEGVSVVCDLVCLLTAIGEAKPCTFLCSPLSKNELVIPQLEKAEMLDQFERILTGKMIFFYILIFLCSFFLLFFLADNSCSFVKSLFSNLA